MVQEGQRLLCCLGGQGVCKLVSLVHPHRNSVHRKTEWETGKKGKFIGEDQDPLQEGSRRASLEDRGLEGSMLPIFLRKNGPGRWHSWKTECYRQNLGSPYRAEQDLGSAEVFRAPLTGPAR